eukprot:2091631-Amphidinium_carterae.1
MDTVRGATMWVRIGKGYPLRIVCSPKLLFSQSPSGHGVRHGGALALRYAQALAPSPHKTTLPHPSTSYQ